MTASRKIASALFALCALGGIATSADAHPIGGHPGPHIGGFHGGFHVAFRHFGFRHYAWHRWGYRHYAWHRWYGRPYGVSVYAAAPAACPAGYHLGYLGRHCWPNRS